MINVKNLTANEQKIIEARRAYKKKWREGNKEKFAEYNRRFWLKKAAEQQTMAKGQQNNDLH